MRRSEYIHHIQMGFRGTLIAAGAGAVSLLLLPLADMHGGLLQKILAYMLPGIFWVSLLAGIMFFLQMNAKRKVIHTQSGPIGLAGFFSNLPAKVADGLLILAIILLIIVTYSRAKSTWLVSFSTALLFLSLVLHGMFNGKNYKYIQSINQKESKE